MLEKTIWIGFWYDESHLKRYTFVFGNFRNQLLVAKHLSSCSYIELPFLKCLLQVYFGPSKPKSIKPHSSITSLICCIWLWDWATPPNFSSYLTISVKSPHHSHGLSGLEFKLLSLSHASFHLAVSGLPSKPIRCHSLSKPLSITTSLKFLFDPFIVKLIYDLQ